MELIAAGGWCAPTGYLYDLHTLSSRDYRAKYGWPEDHDPWEHLDALDIATLAAIIDGTYEEPIPCCGNHWSCRCWLQLPEITVPRGSIRFGNLPENEGTAG